MSYRYAMVNGYTGLRYLKNIAYYIILGNLLKSKYRNHFISGDRWLQSILRV